MIVAREAEYLPGPAGLLRAAGQGRLPVLFHSGLGSGSWSRWSIFATDPCDVFREDSGAADSFERLGRFLEARRIAPGSEPWPEAAEWPFVGGAAGFLAYELGAVLEKKLPAPRRDRLRLPRARLGFYNAAYLADHHKRQGWVAGHSVPGAPPVGEALERLEALIAAAGRAASSGPAAEPDPPADWAGRFEAEVSRADYERGVERILDYIFAGDIYQANYTFRLSRPFSRGGIDLFEAAARLNPAPYSAYLAAEEFEIVSSSPELFLQVEGRKALTRPIKGTIARSADPAEDARRARRLRANPKDMAENIMIVDLERNDLGKVCEFGSVRADRLLEIESFPNVHHLVSTVEGRLRQGQGALEAFTALFPGGSVTGAPKIRAMQIIHELEPVARHVYCGAIGFFDSRGGARFNLPIRTIAVAQGRAWFNVGGGIVADSRPDSEYEECMDKGWGLARTILSLEAQED